MHTSGIATGEVRVRVIDPSALTGHNYEVRFSSLGKREVDFPGTPLEFDYFGWNLKDIDANRQMVSNSEVYGGLQTGYIMDGFQIGLVGSGIYEAGNEILDIVWEGGPEVYDGYLGPLVGWDFFGSSIMPYEVDQTVEIRFDRNSGSKGYVYLRNEADDTVNVNYGFHSYTESPITVWDVTDPDNERQLSWMLVEQRNGPAQNAQFAPTASPGDREYLFILNETYSDQANPAYTGPELSLIHISEPTRPY